MNAPRLVDAVSVGGGGGGGECGGGGPLTMTDAQATLALVSASAHPHPPRPHRRPLKHHYQHRSAQTRALFAATTCMSPASSTRPTPPVTPTTLDSPSRGAAAATSSTSIASRCVRMSVWSCTNVAACRLHTVFTGASGSSRLHRSDLELPRLTLSLPSALKPNQPPPPPPPPSPPPC